MWNLSTIDGHVESHRGYTTEELLKLGSMGLPMLLQEDEYKTVILVAGSNDIGVGFSIESTIENLNKMVLICKEYHVSKVVLCGIMQHSYTHLLFNDALEDYCDSIDTNELNVIFCDILEKISAFPNDKDGFLDSDEIHLNQKGRKYVCAHLIDLLTSKHNTWTITLNSPWFEHVQDGSKKYEGRCYWKSVLKYTTGDLLNIHHHKNSNHEPFFAKIKSIQLFKNFQTALETLPLGDVLPGIESIEDGCKIYEQFVSLKTQESNGVCMIELQFVDTD